MVLTAPINIWCVKTTHPTKGCIKNYTNVVFDVSKMVDSMIGSSAKITDMNYSDMQRLYPRKWTDYLKFKTYKEMFENIFFPKID